MQKHEDFYSSNAKKVLGALEYYNNQRVRFMLEKAAKHKNPAVAKKAKEYLDNWKVPAVKPTEGQNVVPEEK
ncbi:MAG: hypothetical protein RQ748_06620 [Elusimicrobiales bacterium]|nr:hypothetical protein [Elusimicrobiales bacterium]